jgi:hypothetical protein
MKSIESRCLLTDLAVDLNGLIKVEGIKKTVTIGCLRVEESVDARQLRR